MNIKALPSQGKIETLEDKQHGFGDHCIYMYKKQYVAIHFKKKGPSVKHVLCYMYAKLLLKMTLFPNLCSLQPALKCYQGTWGCLKQH